jgi:hypothetical protein
LKISTNERRLTIQVHPDIPDRSFSIASSSVLPHQSATENLRNATSYNLGKADDEYLNCQNPTFTPERKKKREKMTVKVQSIKLRPTGASLPQVGFGLYCVFQSKLILGGN